MTLNHINKKTEHKTRCFHFIKKVNVLWIKKKAGVAKQKDITYIIEQL